MQAQYIRDPITHEPLGLILSTNPSLWEEWLDQDPNPATCDTRSHRDDTDWTQLFDLADA